VGATKKKRVSRARPKGEERATAAPMGWQAQKSAATRDQIAEAAIKCFVEHGYANTTTPLIARKAGLSRGAMLHHFPSKQAVVRVAVEYLHAKRLRAFRKAVSKPFTRGEDHVHLAVQAYWQHVRHPLFVAFFELTVAARTDRELADVLRPAQAEFEREWFAMAREVFPEWRESSIEKFVLGLDLSRHLLEGMAINIMVNQESARERRVLRYLEERLKDLAGLGHETARPATRRKRTDG
jgi:AcrR family transcriptional regulator